jgi:glycosyltransferase involved in cell wall biosynthesis
VTGVETWHRPRRVALVTQALLGGGGVASVVRWLRNGLTQLGYEVDVHNLATSRIDDNSRRLLSPRSWARASLRGQFDEQNQAQLWGANAVELEPTRYRPRREWTRALRDYDLIQVVSGGPALACATLDAGPPVFLQVATRLRWERQALRTTLSLRSRLRSDAMTAWVTRMEIKALTAAEAVLVENAEMLAFARDAGQENVVLAPPGVDTERFHPSPAGWNADGYLLSVCRLAEPRKRLDRLIAAYRDLASADSSAPNLVLAGRGQPPEQIQRLISAYGLTSRIVIRSNIDPDELPDLYRGASVYVQASDEEGLGISVLEAMASGLPVVATDTAGARQCITDGDSGGLVPLTDEASTTTSLAKLVRSVLTSGGAELAQRNRARCRDEFGSEISLERFRAAYDRCLERTGDAREQ